jgi:hypothetical protein
MTMTQPDWYDQHLAAIGRSEDDDRRVAVHEAGHAVAARALGYPLAGATIDPDDKCGGKVWGPAHTVAFGGSDPVPDLCDQLRDAMPKIGEPRTDAADVFLHALNRTVELVSAGVAERMLLPGDPVPSVSDIEHSLQYASLVCKSPEAVEKFIALAEQMADDLLRPFSDVLVAVSTSLKARRTMTGAMIDSVISRAVAARQLEQEHEWRRRWQDVVANASSFKADEHGG